MNVLLYSKFTSPRLTFICYQIFDIWLGVKCRITTNLEIYQQYEGIRINYSNKRILKKEVLLPACKLLKVGSIQKITFNTLKYNKIPALFKMDVPTSTLPFDLLATIFFHLSRYEEYLPFNEDQHKRFTFKESWVYRNECLQLPIVDQLVEVLDQQLKKSYPLVITNKRSYSFQTTYDIDMAWAYKYKGLFRTTGGILKDLFKGDKVGLQEKWQVLFGNKIDPFYTYDHFQQWDQGSSNPAIYFFLLGNYSKYDQNINATQPVFQQLIQKIASTNTIGIHPSYQSNTNLKQLDIEIQRLKNITGQSITRSRQHFLKLHLPDTYRNLLKYNVKEDYSMGYAGQIGFRAGTSLPFYWYDLQLETATSLLIHPFQIMDVTLKEYLHLTPEQAKISISEMIKTIRSINGTFCSLWHNSSFSNIGGWEDWGEVYEYLLEEGSRSQKSDRSS